jgi:DNA integrity scanning protein DisA with diadenylate cyclase activity
MTRNTRYQAKSCGQIAPGFEIRIAADGEVLVRGPTVVRRYWGQAGPSQTVVDAQGWLHTGDLGHLDQDNFLFLTGHKRPALHLSTGRKIIPEAIEQALAASPFIDQAVLFGEGRSYLTALLVPDLEALSSHFQETEVELKDETIILADPTPDSPKWFWPHDDHDRDPVVTMAHPKVKSLLDQVIQTVNQRLDRWDRIERYCLLDQSCSKMANELAEWLTQGRQAVNERYAPLVEAMYPSGLQTDLERITEVRLSPERMRDLLEKESILDAWMADAGIQFLFDLATTKQIDAPSMVHVCDTAAIIAQMESEEKPLSTALIIGDPARIGRVLPPSQIQLLRHDHIRRMRKILVTMAKMVDGLVLGYVVDTYGYVRGVHRLATVIPADDNSFLGSQFRRHALISERCDAIVFYVPAGGRHVRVFANGQMVGRYANGDWSPDNISAVEAILAGLTAKSGYNPDLLRRILRCAFQMSEENLGAIFLIGPANSILERSDMSEIGTFAAIGSRAIDHLTDQELINFAKQDGATVIDSQGYFRGCMVLLRPGADTRVEIGPGKGARHSSAAKMSAEAHCLAIIVSQDGPITVFHEGQRLLSL